MIEKVCKLSQTNEKTIEKVIFPSALMNRKFMNTGPDLC